jgi:hypothetical protein
MSKPVTKPKDRVLGSIKLGATLSFDDIHEPGAYVCRWSGHLLRMPEGAIGPEQSPRISVIGTRPLLVTKIDDDPGIALGEARLRAANRNVSINF